MSDSDSVDETDLPSREECEERCQKFADVTGTDAALAMFYLQDREWNLDRSINAYFEDHGEPGAKVVAISLTGSGSAATKSPAVEDPEPHRIRLLSWNIDGLDTNNSLTRAGAVCDLIKKENPCVVFLQEVIPSTVELLEEKCPNYQLLPGGSTGYFTAIMLKIGSVVLEDHNIHSFYTSLMMRNLMAAKCTVKGVPCHLMTSHLESTAAHTDERKRQLKSSFEAVKKSDKHRTVIFGGDLNLRDKEVAEIGGLPEGILDLWEVTGKRPEAKFTWDCTRNDNTQCNGKFQPRCRFDRLYLRHCDSRPKLKPVYFELVGIERIKSCKRFPSDHWGLLTHFDIKT